MREISWLMGRKIISILISYNIKNSIIWKLKWKFDMPTNIEIENIKWTQF